MLEFQDLAIYYYRKVQQDEFEEQDSEACQQKQLFTEMGSCHRSSQTGITTL